MLEHSEGWDLIWKSFIFIIILFGAVSSCLSEVCSNETIVGIFTFIITLITGVGLYLFYEVEKERRRIEMEKQLQDDFGHILSEFTNWLLGP